METIKTYVIFGLTIIIIVLLLLKSCNDPLPNLGQNKESIIVKIKSDTIWRKDTLVQFKSIIRPKYDTIYKFNDTNKKDLENLAYIREYLDSLSDNEQSIYVKSNITGILNKLDISYKLKKKPELITNTDSIFITKTQPSRFSLYTGLRLSGNATSLNLSPYIELNKDKLSINASYGLIDKTIGLGVGYRLFSSKR